MKKFLVRLSVFFVAPMALLCVGWYLVLTHSHWDNVGLLNFQVAKLKHFKNKHFKVLFIGDSSGGNAIKTDKKNTINFCLSGSYGYEGNTEFINIIRQYITYDTLVVVNTIDISTRPVSDEAQWLPNIYSNDPIKKIMAFKNSFSQLKFILDYAVKHNFDINSKFDLYTDYPVSREKTKSRENKIEGDIIPAKVAEFCKLEQTIKGFKEPYYLFFGPSLPYDNAYFNRLSDTLTARKIAHKLNKPFPLDSSNVGNTEDHVHPDFAYQSTEYYLSLLHNGK